MYKCRPLIKSSSTESSTNNNFDDAEFTKLVHEVETAVEMGVDPERIYQGSSGSYFARNRNRVSNVFIASGA